LGVDASYLLSKTIEVDQTIGEIRRLTSGPFKDLGVDEKYSIRYQIVVLAEAIGSICLHICMEDLNYESRSYGDCFMKLKSAGIISCAEDLAKIVGLRNLLVHRYCTIDDSEVYGAVKDDLDCVEALLRAVRDRYGLR